MSVEANCSSQSGCSVIKWKIRNYMKSTESEDEQKHDQTTANARTKYYSEKEYDWVNEKINKLNEKSGKYSEHV